MRQEKDSNWEKIISSIASPKSVSSLFKHFKHNSSPEMPLLVDQQGNVSRDRNHNLEMLRQAHFPKSTQFFVTNPGSPDKLDSSLTREIDKFLNLSNLNAAIKSLPCGKAPGPDGIKNEVISNLTDEYKLEFLHIARKSIAYGYIPKPWLEVEMIFIPKAGKASYSDPKSYRPIGLSSTMLKLCERLVNWRLKDTILKQGIPQQHAFTLGKSTESAISELVNFLEKAKHLGMKAIVLSIDIEGAFDTVPFDVIKQSLIERGVEPQLISWIDFLSRNRSASAKLGHGKIVFRPLEGTTQGGLNGPDLWIICLWSIIFIRAAKTSHLSKYADDLISALMGKDLSVIRDLLQECLNEFNDWFSSRGLKISAKKSFCLVLDSSRKQGNISPLLLNGEPIPFVKEIKYLGVCIDSGLTWKPHVMQRIRKAKKDLLTARKMISTNWGLSPDKMAWIYEGIVRPALDYSCHVWTPVGQFPIWLKKELDKIQRLALLCITSCIYTTQPEL